MKLQGGVRVEQADSWVDDLLEERLIMLSRQALGSVDDKLLEPVNHLSDEEQVALHEDPLPAEAAEQVQMAEPEPEQVFEELGEIDAESDAVFAESGTEANSEPDTEVAEPEEEMSLEELQAQIQAPEQGEDGLEQDEDWADLAAAGEDSAEEDEELW